jgi:hypothetical protein
LLLLFLFSIPCPKQNPPILAGFSNSLLPGDSLHRLQRARQAPPHLRRCCITRWLNTTINIF